MKIKERVCFNPECYLFEHKIYPGAHIYVMSGPTPEQDYQVYRYICSGYNSEGKQRQFILCGTCSKDDSVKRKVGEIQK